MSQTLLNTALVSPITGQATIKNTREMQKTQETAKEFEATFISEMIKPMFEGIETEGMFGGGKGEEIFRGILVSEYGKIIANAGGIGLSNQIRDQMIKMQNEANNAAKAQ